MKQVQHKATLSDAIGQRNVKAVLINTFNFDPVFFENYLMPLFIHNPDYAFGDNQIQNHILWRQVAKDDVIPAISVYCDFYAKDNTHAPSLGYDVHCVKTPSAPHQITNFHPKLMLILLEENRKESLLLNIGSGNLTVNGWCDNIEAFTIIELKQNKTKSNTKSKNSLQDFLNEIQALRTSTERNEAQELIYTYLKKVEDTPEFHHSFSASLKDFFVEKIPLQEIEKVEVISPYFSTEATLLKWLKKETKTEVTALLPTLKSNEVTMSEESFDKHANAGMEWAQWAERKNGPVNDDLRNLHAKIYRFYSNKKTYTFLGSANFTRPAWDKIDVRANHANVEIGWLFNENGVKKHLLKEKEIDKENYIFIGVIKPENNELIGEGTRNAPEMMFTIDWGKRELVAQNREKDSDYYFEHLAQGAGIPKGKSTYVLSSGEFKGLSRNALIKVVFHNGDRKEVYCFYPKEINFGSKPMGFRITTHTILKFWDNLENELFKAKLIEQYSGTILTKEGTIRDEKLDKPSILNEMAKHYYSLAQLEKYLFKESTTIKEANHQLKLMNHYMLRTSLDTISSYRRDLEERLEKKEIQYSFYWMIIQILLKRFYGHLPQSTPFKKSNEKELKDEMKKRCKNICRELEKEANGVQEKVKDLEKKDKWTLQRI